MADEDVVRRDADGAHRLERGGVRRRVVDLGRHRIDHEEQHLWQCIQALDCDLEATSRAGSVQPDIETLLGELVIGERRSRFVEQCCDLLALPEVLDADCYQW